MSFTSRFPSFCQTTQYRSNSDNHAASLRFQGTFLLTSPVKQAEFDEFAETVEPEKQKLAIDQHYWNKFQEPVAPRYIPANDLSPELQHLKHWGETRPNPFTFTDVITGSDDFDPEVKKWLQSKQIKSLYIPNRPFEEPYLKYIADRLKKFSVANRFRMTKDNKYFCMLHPNTLLTIGSLEYVPAHKPGGPGNNRHVFCSASANLYNQDDIFRYSLSLTPGEKDTENIIEKKTSQLKGLQAVILALQTNNTVPLNITTQGKVKPHYNQKWPREGEDTILFPGINLQNHKKTINE